MGKISYFFPINTYKNEKSKYLTFTHAREGIAGQFGLFIFFSYIRGRQLIIQQYHEIT